MQYLLNEEEMEAVRVLRRDTAKMPAMEALVNVCRWMATSAIGPIRPNSSFVLTTPHGCIHVQDSRGPERQTRCCDHCPVAGICPQPKNWSK